MMVEHKDVVLVLGETDYQSFLAYMINSDEFVKLEDEDQKILAYKAHRSRDSVKNWLEQLASAYSKRGIKEKRKIRSFNTSQLYKEVLDYQKEVSNKNTAWKNSSNELIAL